MHLEFNDDKQRVVLCNITYLTRARSSHMSEALEDLRVLLVGYCVLLIKLFPENGITQLVMEYAFDLERSFTWVLNISNVKVPHEPHQLRPPRANCRPNS